MNECISVVVPIFNEAKSLPKLIETLSLQSLLPKEVIFIDSGSNDDSVVIIQEIASSNYFPFKLLVLINSGGLPGGNRNFGINAAKCNWVAFIDAGLVPEYNWLQSLWECASLKKINAVFGQCRFDSDTAFGKAVCAISYGCGATHAVLPASLFNRSIFDSVGLFPEKLRAAEDLVWLKSFENSFGSRTICNNALVHYRGFPQSFSQLINKYFVYELHTIRSGIITRNNLLLSTIILAATSLVIILFPINTLIALIIFILIRGLILPFNRSQRFLWWDKQPMAILFAIGACAVRDMTKLLVRAGYMFKYFKI